MVEPLSEREREILLLIGRGMSNRDIANTLYLARGTIKAHCHNIYSKLGVSNRTQAVLKAQGLALIPDMDTRIITHQTSTHSGELKGNLPPQLTPFIGRKIELARLIEMLDDERVRLINILGAGGMGKTSLAIELARQAGSHFRDGVFFIALARVSEPKNIPSAVMDDLGLRVQASDDLAQQLLNYLQHKRMLLVLDNFEHLLEGTELIMEMLHAAPNIKVIVTSRERLNLSREVVFVLGSLNYSDNLDTVTFEPHESAQLLLERARFVDPGLELQSGDWPHIHHICQLVQGLPLALILAAGWVDILSWKEIADELVHSLDILESQLRDLPVRQRSMRATIMSSWNQLTDEDKRIYTCLSVFRGGFSRDAAQAVAGATLRQLQTLVNRSFITSNDGRYAIHELLRQFGEEQLQYSDHTDDVYNAHSAYYLDFLSQRDADLKGRRQRAALDEIHADYENVQIAWLWAVKRGDYKAIAKVVDCLANFSVMRAFLVRVEDLFQQTLSDLALPATEIPHPLWDQVAVRYMQSRERLSLPTDLDLLEIILERARARRDQHEIAYCLWVLGNGALRARNYPIHRKCMEECLRIWRQIGDEFYIAHALVGNCGEDMAPERYDQVIQYFRESIEIRRRIGDQYELSFSLMLMGFWRLYRCRYDEAEQCFNECLALQNEADQTPDFAGVVSMLGSLAFWRGDFEAAASYAQAGLDFSQDMNYYGDKSACQVVMSFVFTIRGESANALTLCEEASQYELFDVNAVAVYWGMALAQCDLDDDDEIRQPLQTCLHIAHENLKSLLFQRLCLPIGAIFVARKGERERAVELLALAFDQLSTVSAWMEKWPLLTNLRRDLATELGSDTFNAAWARGTTLDLNVVMTQLLERLATP